MTKNNSTTQDLMWKYKEEFCFPELKEIEQEGELDFVNAIIDDSDYAIKFKQNKWTLTKTRQFVNTLNKRVGGKENFVLILEIYNKLIKFEAISFLKNSLIKMIMKDPQSLHSSNQGTRKDFEKSLNLQEIAISIISSQEMLFIRNFLKELFPLENLFQILDESIQTLNGFEKDDQDYDDQDYEELREVQYVDLINLYIQIYLHPTYSDTKKSELMS